MTKTSRRYSVSQPLTIELDDTLLAAIDSFAEREDDRPPRPEAVRRLLANQLIGLGILAWGDDPEGANGRDD